MFDLQKELKEFDDFIEHHKKSHDERIEKMKLFNALPDEKIYILEHTESRAEGSCIRVNTKSKQEIFNGSMRAYLNPHSYSSFDPDLHYFGTFEELMDYITKILKDNHLEKNE